MTCAGIRRLCSTGHSSATLYEAAHALGRLVAAAVDPAIGAAWSGARLAGEAFTVQGAGGDNLALHRAVLAAPPGSVLVVDAAGAAFGHLGEVLAVAAQQRGVTGLIIDGGVRDTEALTALGFPVFSRNNSIRGTRKLFSGATGVPVEVGGVTVCTGDLVVGDADGVVAVSRDRVGDVLDEADRRSAQERRIIEALRNGGNTIELYGLRS